MEKNKIRSHRPERITLGEKTLAQLDQWIDLIVPKLKGTKINRSEMVSEIILRKGKLTTVEIKEIVTKYFDPEKTLLWAAEQLKLAKKSGNKVDIDDLLGLSRTNKQSRPKNITQKTMT